MFGVLKKKLQKVVDAVTKKAEEKEEEQVEQVIKEEEEAEEIVDAKEEAKLEREAEKIVTAAKEEVEEKPVQKKSWIKKITEKVVRTVTEKKLGEADLQPIVSELETDLIEADVAVETAVAIAEGLKKNLVGREIKRGKEKEIVF